MVDKKGKTFKGDAAKPANTDFYAWGQSVHCMKDGVVVERATSNDDNLGFEPFSDPLPPPNFVLVQHADGDVAAYYHFKKNSIVVDVNNSVKAGDVLGKVGNSGGSSEPHLHIGLVRLKSTGRKTLMPITFKGLFTAEDSIPVTGHPGTDIYQSALSVASVARGVGASAQRAAAPARVKLTALQKESLRNLNLLHRNFGGDH